MSRKLTEHDVKVLAGKRPLCRAKYNSPCCDGPVDVYMGPVEFEPPPSPHWQQKIYRKCAICGDFYEPEVPSD